MSFIGLSSEEFRSDVKSGLNCDFFHFQKLMSRPFASQGYIFEPFWPREREKPVKQAKNEYKSARKKERNKERKKEREQMHSFESWQNIVTPKTSEGPRHTSVTIEGRIFSRFLHDISLSSVKGWFINDVSGRDQKYCDDST